MKDFIYQISNNECGFASLKMALANASKKSDFLYLPNKKDENYQYNLFELKEIAKENGMILTGYKITEIDELFKINKPFILIRDNDNGGKHAVYIKKIWKNFIYIYDPAIGKNIKTKKNMFKNYSGSIEILVVESYSSCEIKHDADPLISNKNKGTILALELASIFCYFLGVFFLDRKVSSIIPLILIIFGAVFSLIYKITTYKILSQFDDKFIKYTYDKDVFIREKNYKTMHSCKSGLLSSNISFILNLTSAIAVNTILILDNYYTCYIILLTVSMLLFDNAFLANKEHKNIEELSSKENHLLLEKDINEDDYIDCYDEAKKLTYKIARNYDIKKLVMIFVLILVTIFVGIVTQHFETYFLLFYSGVSVFTFHSLSTSVDLYKNNKTNEINEVKLYNIINKNKKLSKNNE